MIEHKIILTIIKSYIYLENLTEKSEKDKPTSKHKLNKLTKSVMIIILTVKVNSKDLHKLGKIEMMKLRSKLESTLNNCYTGKNKW